ncbi:MAG: FmdE family protein [Thermodesulfovibrionales bacterium]
MKSLDEVVEFHGHICPGLVLGYRVSILALKEFKGRAIDEELVAIVENNSCAVDAVQVITGCTFGKGNLIFRDYGKQVYTFIKRPSGESLRISVKWESPPETEKEKKMWERYSKGERSEEILKVIHERKTMKIDSILNASDEELFNIERGKIEPPGEAEIYPSVRCSRCGEKVMKTRARVKYGKLLCIPCYENNL